MVWSKVAFLVEAIQSSDIQVMVAVAVYHPLHTHKSSPPYFRHLEDTVVVVGAAVEVEVAEKTYDVT